jgi:hypothetical protein
MFITVLFIVAKLWKQPRCLTTDEWIKKVLSYSAIKNGILWFTHKWMELENIILREVSKVQKDNGWAGGVA